MLPKITHQQFIVLRLLYRGGEFSSIAIKSLLEHYGITQSMPSFYQFMARMIKSKFVHERKETIIEDGKHTGRKNMYCISAIGRTQLDFARYFYQQEQWIKGTNES